MTDESGILGNLPRSRPGRRSDRREAAGEPEQVPTGGRAGAEGTNAPAATHTAAGSAAAAGESTAAPGARPSRRSAPRTPPASTATPSRPPEPGGRPLERGGRPLGPGEGVDVLTGAARAAGGVATAGLRMAARIAGGALRRVPRP